MKLKIYNTINREKQEFQEIIPNQVSIYTCGPTVYRDSHIGNMRAFHYVDLLANIIRHILQKKVKHVINLTDVGHLTDDGDDGDDKMEKGANRENLSVWQLADKYISKFHQSLAKLRMDNFDVYCRATDNIQEQIDMVVILEKKGFTYQIENDGIYMDTSKVPNYGKLVGDKHIEGIQEGARIENDKKRNKTDFALRKFSPKGSQRQMERDSPRGMGFPGWHLECSAMSTKFLGKQIDIHTGGIDHIGVHHTNEIAQSECCFGHCEKGNELYGKNRVNYRMHNQFLNLGGKKLAKANGGLVTVEGIVEKGFDPLDLKFLYITGHYRSFLDFSLERLEEIKKSRQNLIKNIQKVVKNTGFDVFSFKNINFKDKKENGRDGNFWVENIIEALLDDLNTPKMLSEINKMLKSEEITEKEVSFLYFLDKNILKLGLFEFDKIDNQKTQEIPDEIINLANQRKQAKLDKNYELADKLRNEIENNGYIIKDISGGEFEILSK